VLIGGAAAAAGVREAPRGLAARPREEPILVAQREPTPAPHQSPAALSGVAGDEPPAPLPEAAVPEGEDAPGEVMGDHAYIPDATDKCPDDPDARDDSDDGCPDYIPAAVSPADVSSVPSARELETASDGQPLIDQEL
jgi:hypothetical protein